MRKNMKRFAMVFTIVMLFQGFMGVFNSNTHTELKSSVSKLTCCSGIRYEAHIDFEF